MLENDGEYQLDRLCKKCGSVTQSQGGEEYFTYNKKKEGHILHRNCLLKHILKERWQDRGDEKQGRRRKQLLDGLKETTGYCELKEEALDHTLWRTGFGRGYGPVVRQTAK